MLDYDDVVNELVRMPAVMIRHPGNTKLEALKVAIEAVKKQKMDSGKADKIIGELELNSFNLENKLGIPVCYVRLSKAIEIVKNALAKEEANMHLKEEIETLNKELKECEEANDCEECNNSSCPTRREDDEDE